MAKRSAQQTSLFATPRWMEEELAQQGLHRIAGIDEAGRGPLAGPVVAAAVLLPPSCDLPELDDSKRLTEAIRRTLFDQIHQQALAIGVGVVDAPEIDQRNILQATFHAMSLALDHLCRLLPDPPQIVLIDGNKTFPHTLPCKAVIKGDQLCQNVAAASIIAKVLRDQIMDAMHPLYPLYGFDKHKGYPSPAHKLALAQHGPSPLHRLSFRGVLSPDTNAESSDADTDLPL
ncbi:ribonuclease HII [Myxococcota bacterium]|nr:ribonuclease HII [Myxococcota bacterium]